MFIENSRQRVVITAIQPQIEAARFAIKRIVGDEVSISADIFTDGHQAIGADLLFRHSREEAWHRTPMQLMGNDKWQGNFTVDSIGTTLYTIHAWIDYFSSWQKDIYKKYENGQDIAIYLQVGLQLIEKALEDKEDQKLRDHLKTIVQAKTLNQAIIFVTDPELHALMRNAPLNQRWITEASHIFPITVDSPKARFSAWYELFPRSAKRHPTEHGTLKGCIERLPYIAKMGFDILYLPPIHPIGMAKRRGKNNQTQALKEDLGSPWAIGSSHGGHKSIHPDLGSEDDLKQLIIEAKQLGIDIALDIAFQCSPDHPYVIEHPDWFRWLPDRTIQHAENPPKKYEDIVPFYFESEDWQALWEELKSIILYWIERGIKIFRIDNPHTKPFVFWEWLIQSVKEQYPEVLFLAEAFTRPKIMFCLARLGFTQSYTYFAWRHTKTELINYLTELTHAEGAEYFRPNFWPNTPDILTEELQHGNRATFMIRLALAATLSSNYGIYGPAFELLVRDAVPGTEEYLHSEKYESKNWNLEVPNNISSFIARINLIRKENAALQMTDNLQFLEVDNDQLIYYGKFCPSNSLLIVVNLDSFHTQTGKCTIPLKELGVTPQESYHVHELISNRYYIWDGEYQSVVLDPEKTPLLIFKIQKRVRREADFEYFL